MKHIYLASSLMTLGLILIATSFLLPLIAPSLLWGSWTEEQALAHSKVSANLHELAHEKGHAKKLPEKHPGENRRRH